MQDWEQIWPIVREVLERYRYTGTDRYHNQPCFLTAYQIAVLVDKEDETLKGTLPIGGEGVGPDSFARRIAWHLSDQINNHGAYHDRLKIQFFSKAGLEKFTFDNGHEPSANEFSMFQYK